MAEKDAGEMTGKKSGKKSGVKYLGKKHGEQTWRKNIFSLTIME